MPSPGLYVVAVVVGVAAGIAFKEFVYDPHLAPKIEQWTGAYAAYRSERRRRRTSAHSYSHSHSDDEGDGGSFTKSSVELEGLVEREMHTFGREATLRQRRPQISDINGVEMIEKPNTFIPFVPLSPTPPLVPDPFATRGDATLPIGRLPTPQSDISPSQRVPASAEFHTGDVLSQTQSSIPPNPFIHTATFHEEASFLVEPAPASPRITSLTSGHASPEPRAWPGSEYDFALATSQVTSPFTSAGVSRVGTPLTDARSEASYSDVRSRTSVSEYNHSEASFVSDLEHPSPHLDTSVLHSAVYSQASLDNHSDISLDEHSVSSLDTSTSSSLDTRSDASLDFMGSEGDPDAEFVNLRSPDAAHAVLSDEEWERVSGAGR